MPSGLLGFVRRYGVPYLHWYAGGFVALAATNWLSVQIPVELARGIDALVLGPEGHPTVVHAAGIVGLMGAMIIVVRTASRVLFFTPGRLIEARLQRDLFASVLRQQPDFFARLPAGDLTSRLTSDVQNARLLFGFTTLGVVNTLTAVALTGVQMARLSPSLALLVAVPLAIAFAVTAIAVDRMRAVARRSQEELSRLSDHALASFQGIAAVHAFGAEGALTDVFRVSNGALAAASIERARLRVLIGPLLVLASAIDVFLLLRLGGVRAIAGSLTVGEIVAFTSLVAYLASPLRSMTFTLSVARQATVSLERLDEVLLAEPHRPDLPEPRPAPARPMALSLRDLTYRHPGSDRDAIHGVSVEVPAGGVLGVFGPTGAGKTTLVRCLLRLDDPPPGTILADGADVRTLDLREWRRAAVLVPQRAFLFSEALRDNVLLGASDEGQLEVLMDQAQLRVDLAALPDGASTVVGEAGLTLSGGQRQRVAIARGLARDARLLVLDDVLSAVDHTTEALLIRALRDRPTHPTTVIVANRCSALVHADVILVLDRGRVVARGTHAELVRAPGPYAEAWRRQTEGSSE